MLGLRNLIRLICLILIFAVFLLGCQKEDKPSVQGSSPKFAIYFVKEEDKNKAISHGPTENDKSEVKIKELRLDETPVLTDKDIKQYNWQNQKIELTDEYLDKHGNPSINKELNMQGGSKLLDAGEFDAVVITINGERIYKAGFPPSPIRSYLPPGIIIRDSSNSSIEITPGIIILEGRDNALDPRYDKRISDIFQKEGKLVGE